MSRKVQVTNNGVSGTTLIFITFLVLKVTHYIDWDWKWVTAPLWVPLIIVITILIEGEVEGWNDCIDEVKKLNGIKE